MEYTIAWVYTICVVIHRISPDSDSTLFFANFSLLASNLHKKKIPSFVETCTNIRSHTQSNGARAEREIFIPFSIRCALTAQATFILTLMLSHTEQ